MACENLKTELVAQTYANAILELGVDEWKCSIIAGQLDEVARLFERQQELLKVFDSPFVSFKEKSSLIEKIFDGKVDRLVTGLIFSMAKRRRLIFFTDVSDMFKELYDKRNGVKTIHVTTASVLTAPQKKDLEQRLSEAADTEVSVKYKTEPSILGGIIIRSDSEYVDNSLKRILTDAKDRINRTVRA